MYARGVGGDRSARDHYTVGGVPDVVARYAGSPDTLAVGSPGKVGLLELTFARTDQRTELTDHFQRTPLQIMRPLYYDEARPDIPYVLIMSSGGGVLQGDRYRMDLTCAAGGSAHLTTQAATKIYRMEGDYATQRVELTAGPGSFVEYLPEPTIPYVDSRFYQRVDLSVDPTATVILSETVLAGRLARGERNAYAAFCSDLDVRAPGGGPLFADTVRLVPGHGGVTGPAVLGDFGVMATLFVVTSTVPPTVLADVLHEALTRAGARAGASILPNGAGAWARILGHESPEVTEALRTAWDATRRLLIGVPAPKPRRS